MQIIKRLYMLVIILLCIANNRVKSETVLDGYEYGYLQYIIDGSSNDIVLDSINVYKGKYSIKLKNNNISLIRKILVEPLAILQFNTYVKNKSQVKKNNVFISLQYYDANSKLINEFQSYCNDTTWIKYEISMISPPLAEYALIGFNYYYDSTNTEVNFDESYWSSNSLPIPNVKQYNYDKYLRPFWACDTVYDEAILLVSENMNEPQGKLLFSPLEIFQINNSYLDKKYLPNIDYTNNNKTIKFNIKNDLPFYYDTSFTNDVFWYSLFTNKKNYFPQWMNVTYKSKRDWNGPRIFDKVALLNKTYTKLLNKEKLKIAIVGNSISRGMYVSGLAKFKPYMESYFTMFGKYLTRYYQYTQIEYYDLSMPAAIVSKYGVECYTNYIKPVNPDLIVLDFGMADFWGTNPADFKKAIVRIVDSVRANNVNSEFILVSSMMFDPEFLQDTNDTYIRLCFSNLKGYQKELLSLEKIGIANIDLYSLSDLLHKWKKPKDLRTDPVHPNDYMARWYAQSLISALVPVMSGSINKVVNRSNQLVIDNLESYFSSSVISANMIVIANKQDWEFHKLDNGNMRILSNHSKLALSVENNKLVQTNIKDTLSQEWELIPIDNQLYKLKNIVNSKYLAIDTLNNSLIFEHENNLFAQQWIINNSYKKEELEIDTDTTFIESEKDSVHYINIQSNTSWTLQTKEDWLKLDKQYGAGNKSIKYLTDENIDKNQRIAKINITTNDISKEHYVVQSGSRTNINDNVKDNYNYKIIPPTDYDNNIYISCKDCLLSNVNVGIFDINGKEVFKQSYNEEMLIVKIDLSSFPSNKYFIKVTNGLNEIIEKFVIVK